MIATEMLDENRRWQAAEDFNAWIREEAGSAFVSTAESVLPRGVDLKIYGPVVASNLEHMRLGAVKPEIAAEAAAALVHLTTSSESLYKQDLYVARPLQAYASHGFKISIKNLQEKMADGGNIQEGALPAEYAMHPEEGKWQVKQADTLLSVWGPRVARVLADSNYSLYFSSTTMLTGAELPSTTIDDIIESDTHNQMPHLTLGNYGHAQLAAQVAKNSRGQVSIFDTGAGTAATSAAYIGGIGEVAPFDNVSMTLIESNAGFYNVLEDFAVQALAKIHSGTPGFELVRGQQPIKELGNALNLVNADIYDYMKGLEGLPTGKEDIALVIGNFVWHRLTSYTKRDMIRSFDDAENVIFSIGDLARNGSSFTNRRYFNFGNNGPLNCGNLGLSEIFKSEGYKVIKLGQDEAPAFMNSKLAEALAAGQQEDGHFWIAYKGDEAERVLNAS